MIRGKTYLKDNAKVRYNWNDGICPCCFICFECILSHHLISSKHEIRFSGILLWQNEIQLE